MYATDDPAQPISPISPISRRAARAKLLADLTAPQPPSRDSTTVSTVTLISEDGQTRDYTLKPGEDRGLLHVGGRVYFRARTRGQTVYREVPGEGLE